MERTGTKSKYALAMYDVRGKQEFIYRSQRIKEIIGGSSVIADIYKDYLYPAADKYGREIHCKGIFHETDLPFSGNSFIDHVNNGYIGEVVYEGGGNFFVLYKDEDTWKEVNKRFTQSVLDAIGTLKVLSSCIEVDGFDNYSADIKKLMAKHKLNEAIDPPVMPTHILPIVMRDRQTSMPITHRIIDAASGEELELPTENFCKRSKFNQLFREPSNDKYGNKGYLNEAVLDNLVSKKGEDSMLAVIYIDGNGMGAKVEEFTAGKTTYDDAVNALREFSKSINTKYVEVPIKEIEEYFKNRNKTDTKNKHSRFVIGAGDEMTIICNAHDAMGVVKTYFAAQAKNGENDTSCAGIAVFHSHAPFADAYRFAEACCESGKKRMKKTKITNARLMDFHMIQSGMSTSLEATCKHEAGDIITRPWYLYPDNPSDEDAVSYDINGDNGMINKAIEYLGSMGRSNIKGLANCALAGDMELMSELMRIEAHRKAEDPHGDREITAYAKLKEEIKVLAGWNDEKLEQMLRGMIYDVVLGWDLWFADEFARIHANKSNGEEKAKNEWNI